MQTAAIWQQQLHDFINNHQTTLNKSVGEQLQQMMKPIYQLLQQHQAAENPNTVGIRLMQHLLLYLQDTHSLLAALCYTPWQQASPSLKQDLCKRLPNDTCKLLKLLQQMQLIDHSTTGSRFQSSSVKADKLRKLLLAMAEDTRVVVLKLCERLCQLQLIDKDDKKSSLQTAQQVLNIYAPLANRLGMGQLKWQLEDFAIRITDAKAYHDIATALDMRRQARECYLVTLQQQIMDALKQGGMQHVKISSRAKHISSIMRKLQKKNLTMQTIYDTLALRITTPSIRDCYKALSIVHSQWDFIASEFDDYIAHPKANGYRSIHTIINTDSQHAAEIQIRTFDMHDAAELGVASHWRYKENNTAAPGHYAHKIDLLRQILSWQQNITAHEQASASNTSTERTAKSKTESKADFKANSEAKPEIVPKVNPKENLETDPEPKPLNNPRQVASHIALPNLFADYIYVLTPEGDIIDLPQGATPLDFAYHVHTEVGHRARGAKINGRMVPLTYTLQSGDQVSILTHKEARPSRDWLGGPRQYLATARARKKVAHYFARELYTQQLQQGQTLWDKHMRSRGFHKQAMQKLCQDPACSVKNNEDLLVALASGRLSVQAILKRLRPSSSTSSEQMPAERTDDHQKTADRLKKIDAKEQHIIKKGSQHISDAGGLLLQTAGCCLPVPGDRIMGFITQGRGIILHREGCRNFNAATKRTPERQMTINWPSDASQQLYPCRLLILADSQQDIIHRISIMLTALKIPLQSIHSNTKLNTSGSRISLRIRIGHLQALNDLIKQLQQLTGIERIYRQSE